MQATLFSTPDFVIIGAGIVGLSLARALKLRDPACRIVIIEKEPEVGRHASGRNSGVLHSGIYYPPTSLKAQVCRTGAQALTDYCIEHALPMETCGKVIVPIQPDDEQALALLYERGMTNGVPVRWLNASELAALEPDAQTVTGQALLVESTGAFSPKAILKQLCQDLEAQGVQIAFNQRIQQLNAGQGTLVLAGGERLSYGHLFNTAGLHADRVAKAFGIGETYTFLPFKGLYYRLDPHCHIHLSRHLYPVPDLGMPFLGVHFTRDISGTVYVGPTAVPALGRENYRLLEGLDWQDSPQIIGWLARLYWGNQQNFRNFAHQEGLRFFKRQFLKAAQTLVPGLQAQHLQPCEKVGIRPQLLDIKKQSLVHDFLVENGPRSTHVLNAISPAFTSAFAFAQVVLAQYEGAIEISHASNTPLATTAVHQPG